MKKDMTPVVSIIVPVYNAKDTLAGCLDALRMQTYSNIEIVTVDDGSTDGSDEILAQYAAKDSRIRVIRQENGGVAKARNVGIAHANGEWIAFSDSDDEFLPDGIQTLLYAALAADTAMSMGGYYRITEKKGEKPIVFSERVLRGESLLRFLFEEGKHHNYLWNRLFRADLFCDRLFPERMVYEDLYLLPQLALAAQSCAISRAPVYRYHVGSGGITGSANADSQLYALVAATSARNVTCGAYPKLCDSCSVYILEVCCFLLGKLSAVSHHKNEDAWMITLDAFRRENAAAGRLPHSLAFAAFLFGISPHLLGRTCRLYSALKNA